MKKVLRTFVAVEIDRSIRSRTKEIIEDLRRTSADVSWVEPENLHITLKFLGNVQEREIVDLCRAVQRGVSKIPPFDLEIRGVGAFPKVSNPHTVWLGAGNGVQAMIGLHDAVEDALAELGYRKEHRQYQTHLTLGRVRGGGPVLAELIQLLQQHENDLAGSMTVGSVTVFSSTLTPDGPIYDVLGVANLRS